MNNNLSNGNSKLTIKESLTPGLSNLRFVKIYNFDRTAVSQRRINKIVTGTYGAIRVFNKVRH